MADEHVSPISRNVRSEYTPWLADDIMKQIRHRNYLKKKAVWTGSPNIYKAYKQARNYVTRTIERTKSKYFMKCFQETSTNPKEMWKTINRVLNKKAKTTNVTGY